MSDGPLEELAERERAADEGGGAARQERQRRMGRLTVRERIGALLDEGSFSELGRHVKSRHGAASERLAANLHPGDGLVCGLGTVSGGAVAVWATDPTVLRGAIGAEGNKKLCRLLDLAFERSLPVLALVDSDGMRVEEGTHAVEALGELIQRTLRLRERAPQLTLVCGLCVGGAAYNAVLTDFVAMVDQQSFMFVTGGKVSKEVTGEDRELVDLGAPALHAKVTGSCHAVVASEREGIALLKGVLGYCVQRKVSSTDPADRETPALETLIPSSERRAYDVRKVLAELFDSGSVLELSSAFAPNLVTAFARLEGRAVAVVASQPMQLAGCLDVSASRKGAAFVRWAGRLGIPIVTLVDTPGYLPGLKQEEEGILPHGATLLEAYAGAPVPKVSFVLRKSFGGANVLSFAGDVRLGLPTATVDVMGADAAVMVVLGDGATEAQREAWEKAHGTVWAAADAGYLDRVVAPKAARRELAVTLKGLAR